MRIYLVLIMSFFVIVQNVQAIVINEIMYSPSESLGGTYNEWIELYNSKNETVNITDWIISETFNHSLSGLIQPYGFIVVVRKPDVFHEYYNVSCNITKATFSLKNGGEEIILKNKKEEIEDILNYSDDWGGDGDGMSLQKINDNWLPSQPTPCEDNIFYQNKSEENQTNTTNQTCDLSLSIASDLIFNSDKTQNYYLEIEDENCDQTEKEVKIEYRIEDLFGTIIKSKYTTNQSITCYKNISRQWTPREIEGSEACYIKALIIDSACNDSDPSNDIAEKLIVVKGGTPDPGPCPPCETTEETSTCSCGPCPKCVSEEETEEESEEFGIISYPEEISKDSEIEIKINLENPSANRKNYTIYSYVYEGNKPVSLGFDGNSWLNTWNANSQNFTISGNSSLNLTLKNRIANDTEPGEYKLRVRIWLDGKKHDLTNDIIIKEPAKPANQTINQTVEKENKTEYNESEGNEPESEINIPTARMVSKSEENWFSILIESVINFFKNLFSL